MQSKAAKDGRALWANVYLDGKLVGQTALNLPRLAPGRHRVVLRRPGYHSVSRRVLLRPGQRRVLRATLKKK